MITIKRNRSGLLCYIDDVQNKSNQKSRLEKFEQIDLNSHCLKFWTEESKMMFHVVNESGSGGSSLYGAQLQKMGRKKGVPDWLVMIPCSGYHGLYVELKRSRVSDSGVSKESKEFLLNAEKLGYKCVIAYGYLQALGAIRDYLAK